MIRISKDRVLEDFFIDDNGIITNKEGEVQKIYYNNKRPCFKQVAVHKIQMYTKYGWRDGHIWAIHHLDEDKSNNSISNLVFMTHSEHSILHHTGRIASDETKKKMSENNARYWLGKKLTEDTKKKLSESHKGKKLTDEHKKKISEKMEGIGKGKKFSEEHKKNISKVTKGTCWFNDGVKNYHIFPENALPHYQKGRLICKK